MERALRIQPQTPRAVPSQVRTERSVRIDKGEEMRALVDRLFDLKQRLKEKEAAHKAETEALALQVKELTAELQTYASEHKKKSISGNAAIVMFSPSISRRIEPEKLLAFLKKFGKISEFWKMVKVNIGDATKHYGEAVLEAEGVLKIEQVEYGNLKIIANNGV